jgi:TonB family protein
MIAICGLLIAPLSLAAGWAAGYEQGSLGSTPRTSTMQREATTSASPPSSLLIERSPTTTDEYAAYVRDRLQVAAMQLRQEGMAELKLTINKDGSIREAEIVEASDLPMQRDQLAQLVNRIKPLPPLPGNIDALVVTTALTLDYPGRNLYDHYGWLPRSPG